MTEWIILAKKFQKEDSPFSRILYQDIKKKDYATARIREYLKNISEG